MNGEWNAGDATYKAIGTGRRRVIVYGPTKKSRVASACKSAIRSWNWTVVVAVAFMIALVVSSSVSSHTAAPAALGGRPSTHSKGVLSAWPTGPRAAARGPAFIPSPARRDA